MWFFILKVVISGLIVALVSTIAKRYPAAGGILAALPIISILALVFLYHETGGNTLQVSKLSFSIGCFVVPTALFLLLIPILLRMEISFRIALVICLSILLAVDGLLIMALKKIEY
jgi:hypothetical protein